MTEGDELKREKNRMAILALRRLIATALASAAFTSTAAQAQAPVPSPTTTEFDGTWNALISCPPFKIGGAYSHKFGMTVKNGFAHGGWGVEGQKDSIAFTGQIKPDGTVTMVAKGLTGDTKANIGGEQPGV